MKNQAWSRRLLLGCAAALLMLTAGDSALTQVVASDIGNDPLAVLDQQVKSNVLIVLDSSGSMRFPGNSGANLGGDDPLGRMYQAKDAVSQVVTTNAGKVSFGLASYGIRNHEKFLAVTGDAGPLLYVSADANAGTWTGSPATDYFDNNPTLDYLGTGAGQVYRSFATFGTAYEGPGCAVGVACRRYLFSRILRNDVVFRFNTGSTTGLQTGYPQAFTCPNPPAGLFPQDPNLDGDATTSDINRACFRVESTAAGNPGTVFYYSSGVFEADWDDVDSCQAAASLAGVAHCATDNTETIKGFLKPEMPVTGCTGTTEGLPCALQDFENNTTDDLRNTNPPGVASDTVWGLLSAQATPLGGVLSAVRTNFGTYFPSVEPGQRHFVLLLTDGDETCGGDPAAQALTNWNNSPRIETLVVGFGLNSATLNQIARNGSGGARDAYTASTTEELIAVLNQALLETSSVGGFSSQGSTSASVFEFGASPVFPAAQRIDPFEDSRASATYRYSKVVPVTYQATFEMPGFVGHLDAYIASTATAPVKAWDAGDMLCRQVTGYPATTTGTPAKCDVTGAHATAMGNGSFTFADMTGANGGAPNYTQTSGRLKRRIFTTSRNGVFRYGTDLAPGAEQQLVPLWPPHDGVDPGFDGGSNTYPNGALDAALGIDSMDFAALQSTFNACRVSTVGVLHADCSVVATRLSRARKEARETILAYAAGAVVATTGGLPDRTGSSGAASGRGQILYKARDWMLGEATLSSVVVITQPLRIGPNIHTTEYASYRTAYRDTALPRMSVVYYGANDGLHAFRGGPAGSAASGVEQGGQELWAFVPVDQLAKLRLMLVEGQNRANHKYVIASGLRSADVFVPDPGDPATGLWRTYLFFGRGLGGKHYTALDVTNPGTFTTPALATTPPLAVWNRGNPDTQDGATGGAPNYQTNASVDLGVTDLDAYLTMGQTWSTPALARVRTVTDDTDPVAGVELNQGLEFMLYAGSGYSSVATEGRSFYSINPLTGDIITSADVGSNATSGIPNALAANVAVFNPGQLTLKEGHPANSVGTRVYVGDVHGRLWKFVTDDPSSGIQLWDFGVDQPIGSAVGLLNYDSRYDTPPSMDLKPHIYVTTGNDRRVPAPPEEPADFLFTGLRDDETDTPPIATELFSFVLPERYRGTTQPSTFLTTDQDGASARVVVAVTRFNPVSATNCSSSFDSRIYIVSAGLGEAAFDVNGDGTIDDSDESWEIEDEKVTGVRLTHGQLVVDKGLNPPPDKVPPLKGNAGGGSPLIYTGSVNASGSTVCR